MKQQGISILVILVLGFSLIGAVSYAADKEQPIVHTSSIQWVTCYEDEVIIWHNDSHSKCWPLDDIWMLQEVQ